MPRDKRKKRRRNDKREEIVMVRALLSAIWIKDWGKSIVSMDPIRDLRIL